VSLAHRILDYVIFYGLLVTIVFTAIPYGTVQPLWIAAFECLIFVFGLLAVADLLITKDELPAGASNALPLLALCGFLVIQSFPLFSSSNTVVPAIRLSISADRFSTLQVAVKMFALIVGGLLLLRYAETESRLRVLVYVIIGVGVASALFGILRQGTSGPGWLLPLPNEARGFAQFVNRNHFGFMAEMSLGLTLGLLVQGSSGYQRWLLFLPIALLLWLTVIISNSRGAIFALLCQLLFLVILRNPLRRSTEPHWGDRLRQLFNSVAVKSVLFVALVVIFAYGVGWVGGEAVVSNFEVTSESFSQQGGHEHRENVSRKDIWAATWKLIKAHPIVGSGFGGYWIAITKYHNASGRFTPQEVHNDYLELLAGGGVIGTALVAWFAVRFLKSARNTLYGTDRWLRAAALGAVTSIFGVMVHSFLDFGLHVTANALIFAALVSVSCHQGLTRSIQETSVSEIDEFGRFTQTDFAAH
jgi:O-antigen ligase